jgi:hypothetical protein
VNISQENPFSLVKQCWKFLSRQGLTLWRRWRWLAQLGYLGRSPFFRAKNVEGSGWEMVSTPRTFGDLEFLLALVVILFLGASVPSFEQTDVCVQQSHNSTS